MSGALGDLVVVAVTVAPVPILFLLIRRQLAKIAIGIAMIFAGPLVVINHFVVVPHVIVAVVRVIDPVVMMCASRAQYGRCQGSGQNE